MRRTAQLAAMVSGLRRPLHNLSPPWLDGCPRADQTWAKKMGNFYLSALGKALGSSREMMDKGGQFVRLHAFWLLSERAAEMSQSEEVDFSSFSY